MAPAQIGNVLTLARLKMMSEQKIEILKLACQAALLSPKIEAKKAINAVQAQTPSNTFIIYLNMQQRRLSNF